MTHINHFPAEAQNSKLKKLFKCLGKWYHLAYDSKITHWTVKPTFDVSKAQWIGSALASCHYQDFPDRLIRHNFPASCLLTAKNNQTVTNFQGKERYWLNSVKAERRCKFRLLYFTLTDYISSCQIEIPLLYPVQHFNYMVHALCNSEQFQLTNLSLFQCTKRKGYHRRTDELVRPCPHAGHSTAFYPLVTTPLQPYPDLIRPSKTPL